MASLVLTVPQWGAVVGGETIHSHRIPLIFPPRRDARRAQSGAENQLAGISRVGWIQPQRQRSSSSGECRLLLLLLLIGLRIAAAETPLKLSGCSQRRLPGARRTLHISRRDADVRTKVRRCCSSLSTCHVVSWRTMTSLDCSR